MTVKRIRASWPAILLVDACHKINARLVDVAVRFLRWEFARNVRKVNADDRHDRP